MHRVNDKLISYASGLAENTLNQAMTSATMPFIWPHIALMPDAHLGKGTTVGSVIPTVGAIMPAAVGVDIGCGMLAYQVNLMREEFSPAACRRIREGIEIRVPVSAGKYNHAYYNDNTDVRVQWLQSERWGDAPDRATDIAPNWDFQLGSLGSGNHFIEVSEDENGKVWLFLHSGSRGVGNKLAMFHIKKALKLCDDAGIDLPSPDLAWLHEGTQEFSEYMSDLEWAQNFALLNRYEMMERVVNVVRTEFPDFEITDTVSCHHNYTEQMPAQLIHAFGADPSDYEGNEHIWLSRKGAVDASEGVMGLVPGSMGDLSYVVCGLGDRDSLWSSPHGAGREYSRNTARKAFTMDDLERRMEGVEWRHTDKFLDEHPMAYKRISRVMHDANTLVSPVHELKQFINVKGD